MKTRRDRLRRSREAIAPAVVSDTDELRMLLARCADGEIGAFEAVYAIVASRIYGLMVTIVGDGVASETLTCSVLAEVWDHAGEHASAVESGEAWILSRAHRRAVEERRRHLGAADEVDWRDVAVGLTRVDGPFEGMGQEHVDVLTLGYFGGFARCEISAATQRQPIDVARAATHALRALATGSERHERIAFA